MKTMNKLKTPNEIQKLNYNDVAFLTNKSTSEAKWDMSTYIYKSEDEIYENLTKTGVPKIGINDLVDKSDFETKIKSCSALDGLNSIDHLIETHNKGIPTSGLLKFSENPTFRKAIKFTGKYSILNDILNREQFLKLQKSWLFNQTYGKDRFSDKTIKFIITNDWSTEYLTDKGISHDIITEQIEKYNESKKN